MGRGDVVGLKLLNGVVRGNGGGDRGKSCCDKISRRGVRGFGEDGVNAWFKLVIVGAVLVLFG